jgi:hypothetical protein
MWHALYFLCCQACLAVSALFWQLLIAKTNGWGQILSPGKALDKTTQSNQ